MPSLRTILGFLIAPISPGLLIGLVASAFGYGTPGEQIWLIVMSAKLGYPIAVALGVPLWLLFRRRGWSGLLTYVMAGALLGLIAYVIYFALGSFGSHGLSELTNRVANTGLVYIPLAVICGAVAGLTFWLIARPDRAKAKSA